VTNFSNVNMAFTAVWGLLRFETDPTLVQTYRTILQDELWDNSHPHVGLKSQQAFFNLLYAGLKSGPTDAAQAGNASAQLSQFSDPPYFNPLVENCDAAELAAGSCIAVDGTTVLTIDSVPARGGGVAAVDPLPKSVRPPSDFEWRSDPRVVNGGGGNRLNPGGDFRAAYWMGRYLQTAASGTANISPIARNPDGSGGPGVVPLNDAGVAGDATSTPGDASTDAGTSDGATSSADTGIPGGDASGVDSATGLDPDAGTSSDDSGAANGDATAGADASTVSDGGSSGDTGDPGPAAALPAEGCTCSTMEPNVSWAFLAIGLFALLRRKRAS
jgi:hypothetical protein